MGNSIGGRKKKTAKVMMIDGTTFRVKPPVQAGEVVRDHPACDLLESEEVKRLGLGAQPLHPNQPLLSGKLYFLIQLPRLPDQRRAWSGALRVSAKDRLESLKLKRRSVSDLSASSMASVENAEGGVRVRMRLPKAEVARLMEGSKDSAEAAQKIMELCMAREREDTAAAAAPVKRRKEVKSWLKFFRHFSIIFFFFSKKLFGILFLSGLEFMLIFYIIQLKEIWSSQSCSVSKIEHLF